MMFAKQIVRLVVTWLVEISKSISGKRVSRHRHSNQVTQSGNFAGGDIVAGDKKELIQSGININIFAVGPLDNEQCIVFLKANFSLNEDYIRSFLKSKVENHFIESIDQDLLLFNILNRSNLQNLDDQIQKEYDNIVLGNKMKPNDEAVKNKIQNAATCLKKLEFDKAHQLLTESLKIIRSTDKLYNSVYKEYLITGFICYTRRNDIPGLRSLLHQKSEIGNEENSTTDYIISIIFQEIFSRDTDINGLHEVVSRLTDIYNNATETIKPAMANSLGLAYRRLGERRGIIDLEKAIIIFKEGLELNKDDKKIEIELKDQMAITHIRIFECNKDEEQLNTAEALLKDCLRLLEGPMDPRDYRLKPRVLNNVGNIYKQKVLIFNDIRSAPKAIAYYEEAAQYWNEKDASYDWALLRKNIAETKYAVGKLTNDREVLSEALKESIDAIKYRNLKNSPYQWGKTVKIAFSIAIFLNKLNALNLVPISIRKKILSFTEVIIEDEAKWSENMSLEFVQNAHQIQTLLL